MTGRNDLALATLARHTEGFTTALATSALYAVEGKNAEALKWRAEADVWATKMPDGFPVIDAYLNLTLLEAGREDPARARELLAKLESAPLHERRDDLRYFATRVLLAEAMNDADALRKLATSEYPEVAELATGLRAVRTGDLERARVAFARAYSHSSDGRFAIVEHYHAARVARMLARHEQVIASCEEVIQPRVMMWSWASTIAPCKTWTAEAKAALTGGRGEPGSPDGR